MDTYIWWTDVSSLNLGEPLDFVYKFIILEYELRVIQGQGENPKEWPDERNKIN